MTLRAHMAAVALQIPEAAEELFGPPLPPYTESAWGLFWELNATRGSSSAGLQPITHTEMRAYQHNMQRRLTPLDIRLVREADEALLSETRARAARHDPDAPEAE